MILSHEQIAGLRRIDRLRWKPRIMYSAVTICLFTSRHACYSLCSLVSSVDASPEVSAYLAASFILATRAVVLLMTFSSFQIVKALGSSTTALAHLPVLGRASIDFLSDVGRRLPSLEKAKKRIRKGAMIACSCVFGEYHSWIHVDAIPNIPRRVWACPCRQRRGQHLQAEAQSPFR